MHKQLTALAKRALAFALALVLLLALVPALPLAANAAYTTDGWEYFNGYDWLEGRFHSDKTDLVYTNNEAYDWKITVYQGRTDASLTVDATVKDESGKTVASVTAKPVTATKNADSTMLTASDLTGLTTELYGSFTLTCSIKYKGTLTAQLTKTFKRISSVSFTTTVSSRSNPDNVFTFADPIDLVMNIKQDSGVAVAYNAAVTVTNASGTEVLAARGVPLPVSTNITLSVKDLVNLPAITTAGTYKVNLTLTDSTGAIQYQTSSDFAVVALTGSVTATVTSATSSNLVFDNAAPDVVVNLEKTDGIAETFITNVTITNSNGSTEFTDTFESDVPATGVATIAPNLATLPITGTFDLVATVTDEAGNLRASTSATFTRTSSTPMTCTLTDKRPGNTGKIYYSGSDIYLQLQINHKASANQTVTIKAIGTLNGNPYEQVATTTKLGLLGTKTVTINTLPSYGVFEDIHFAVYAANGNELWRSTETFSFSRIPTASTPGSLPLLNINDHFTSGKGDGATKLALAAKTGANMWRACIPWATIESSMGSYDISVVKPVMDATKSNGMQALVILAYNNDLYGSANPTDSTWLNAYANYCYYVADMMALYYPDQVVGFEIWNEWNHATMGKVPATYRTGAHYATVVKAASEKINQVNRNRGTNFKVIAGATAGDGYGETNSNTFIKAMLAASGFLDAIDGISFHTYSSKETTQSWNNPRRFEYISPAEHDFAARISNYKSLLSQYNAPSDLEVWLTETGWTTNTVPESTNQTSDGKTHITTGATEQEAAAYMVQLYTWALADGTLDRIFWYDFMNDISNQTKVWANNQTESNYGLIHNWNNSGDQPLAYSAKQGYVAMCALSSKLSGATNGKAIDLGDGIFAYQFAKDGKYITVVWTDGATKTLTANLSKSISVSDMYGNATTYDGSSAELTLSEAPIYIEYASGAISSFS